ncbi:MAG: acyl-CoA desaturase [Bacteroidetes bacterium]|nr:acyl-CoA desaturase [Bacteroidota bacterium]
MTNKAILRFDNTRRQFYTEAKKRVDAYFKEHGISKHGNWNMYLKTIFMFALYFVPYFLLVFNVFDHKGMWFLMAVLMGMGMAGIGLCVMHDANHGSYSRNTKFNNFLGFFSLNILGGHAMNWKIQHNVIHHTYTNVHEVDEDIAPPGIMRFEPHTKRKWIHKFQFLYAWLFYGLMTMMWTTSKDFKQVFRYHKMGHLKTAGTTLAKELSIVLASKVLYYAYMLLPYFFIKEMTFLNWLVGFLTIHYIAGLSLALIFQPAHVVQETEFPLPAENGNLENHWAEHQMRTTMNFANGDPIFSWLVGGLNFQVEHHLFPTICHIHYPKISKILKQVAQEFNVPYNSRKTFVGALWSHEVMLWKLGRVAA